MQDALYGVDRATGAIAYRHELPAGIYIDNLVSDASQRERVVRA